jgi:hypothetical protein
MDGKVGERMNKGFTDKIRKYLNIKTPNKNEDDYTPAIITSDELIRISKMLPENYNDKHNRAPSFKECLEMARKYPEVIFVCYIIGKRRPDERISIDTIYAPKKYTELITILKSFRPDEVDEDTNVVKFWWD